MPNMHVTKIVFLTIMSGYFLSSCTLPMLRNQATKLATTSLLTVTRRTMSHQDPTSPSKVLDHRLTMLNQDLRNLEKKIDRLLALQEESSEKQKESLDRIKESISRLQDFADNPLNN